MDRELRATKLRFGYDVKETVINDVSLHIPHGKVTALIGANGCGKSTLFQLFTGRLKPESGEVSFQGKNIRNIKQKEFAKKVAVVHQHNTAPADITVRKLVEMGRTPYQSLFSYSQKEDDKNAVNRAMEATNVLQYENRMVSQLSGGQRQRVWMAMALAQEPEVLLLDEITTYLDIHYQMEILSLVCKLNREKEITVLMVLHDINQAMEYADEIVVMKEGRIIASGKADEVVAEKILEEAFRVKVEIIEREDRKYCIFSEKTDR